MKSKESEGRTLLLDEKQIEQRINRLAYQIYEDNVGEERIILAGIVKSGYMLAEKITKVLKQISPLNIQLAEVHIDKHSQVNKEITLSINSNELSGRSIVVVDDVLNSGKTMMYSLKPFLAADIKKIRIAVLVDRNHKRFPVFADFAGHSLATTLKEHVSVEIDSGGATAWLS